MILYNTQNINALTQTLQNNNVPHDIFIQLINKTTDVNRHVRDYGPTALIFVAAQGRKQIVELLLKKEEIDVNAKDELGMTAPMHATKLRRSQIVKLLLEKRGIDVKMRQIIKT